MTYTYKMVQVPPSIVVQEKAHRGNEAAAYLQAIVNKWAAEGWEFYRVDEIGVHVEPGCLSGRKAETQRYYVVTFRRDGETCSPQS